MWLIMSLNTTCGCRRCGDQIGYALKRYLKDQPQTFVDSLIYKPATCLMSIRWSAVREICLCPSSDKSE